VAAAEATGITRYMASAMWCLGQTYAQLGDCCSSYNHLQAAYGLFNALPPGEVESQRLGSQCGIDLMDSARMVLPDRGDVVSLARSVETKCAALSDVIIHARCLVLLGAILRRQQPDEALRYLDQARTTLKAVGNTYNLANAYQIISWVHYDEGRFPAALDAAEEAFKLAELTDNPLFQAEISMDLGKILFSANRDTKAWEHIEIALMMASCARNRLTIARSLEYMGYGYLRKGDYKNAYGAYEAAAENYLDTLYVNDPKRCSDNMARIKQKEENPDAVVGFYRPAIDIDWHTLFYPPVQAFAVTSNYYINT